jgi:acetoin utilization deacetylase AcuC-like enzyme
LHSTSLSIISHPKAGMHVQPFPKPHIEAFESPIRIQAVEKFLHDRGVFEWATQVKAPRASFDDILTVHSPYLVDSVKIMSDIGSGQLGEAAYASPDLMRNALIAAGGAKQAAQLVAEGQTKHAFSLLRPPGHHASTSTPTGLCYFNNVAIAVKYLLDHRGIERISILDFDDHFGNGTSEIFYADKRVQFISIHEYDYENYGIGFYQELGFGEALGTNINIPLIDGADDTVYRAAIDRIVVPSIDAFKPQLIAVSAGFDPHYADPVGNMDIDSATFWYIGSALNSVVDEMKLKGTVHALEGGYNPLALGPSIFAYLEGLAGKPKPTLDDQLERTRYKALTDRNLEILDEVIDSIVKFW